MVSKMPQIVLLDSQFERLKRMSKTCYPRETAAYILGLTKVNSKKELVILVTAIEKPKILKSSVSSLEILIEGYKMENVVGLFHSHPIFLNLDDVSIINSSINLIAYRMTLNNVYPSKRDIIFARRIMEKYKKRLFVLGICGCLCHGSFVYTPIKFFLITWKGIVEARICVIAS